MSSVEEPDGQERSGSAGEVPLSRTGQVPGLPGDPPPRPEPPKQVNVSFGLWVAAGLVMIAGLALAIVNKQTVIDAVTQQGQDSRISAEQIASGTTTLLWLLLLGGVAFGGMAVLFAYKAREGTRSARTVLAVLTVPMLVFQLSQFANMVTTIAAVVAVFALLLLYTPQVAGYFPKLRPGRP